MVMRTLLLTLVTCAVAPCPISGAQQTYRVGVSRVDITPDYPIRLNGFGNRRKESEGVSQRIFAKAIAIGERVEHGAAAPPLVLVAIDSLGIRTPHVAEVARRLQKSHNLPSAHLAITFTHSHCAPKVNGASDNIFSQAIPEDHQKHIDRYTDELIDRMTNAAQQALESMAPARLEWAVGEVKFAKNRRTMGGLVDHDLPTMIVRDAVTDKVRAVYVSYACHCVTLSFNRISGDWAGHAAQLIERQHPGAIALVSIGAGSDQNPIPGVTGDKVEVAKSQGLEIANEVSRLLKGKWKSVRGRPTAVLKRIPLPLNKLPSREQLQAQTSKGRPTDRYNATTQLDRLDRGEPLLSEIDYTIQTWTFGDSLCMTFLAGEVCVDYAKRLKQELDRDRFWLNTYSNDFCCYIPSERLVREGGYGGGAETPYFALPTTLKAGLEKRIIDEVLRQTPKTFRAAPGTQGVPPKTPEESTKCLQTAAPDLHVTLAAAEPQVMDPVAIDFGVDGRLWVAEMNDYGQDVYATFKQQGRVRWLRDVDQDGVFEHSETFVDGLRFPTDVKVWRDGVLICDAPDILFAVDTDGDGRADRVEKLYTGFEVRNAQARVNSLRFGLDGWLYGASGLFGGKITSTKTGQVVDCSNRDFRCKPDTGEIEAVGGRTQQGRCRNDWGDWFGCSNGSLLRYIPSDDDYAKRNRTAPLNGGRVVEVKPAAFTLYPPANLVRFELSGAPGRATSACGLGIYRDTRLGVEFQHDAFTCEPVHQSVHRIDLHFDDDRLLGGRGRGEERSEFLSSTDRWFRPVQVRTGPDGALWVVDMYRYVIEHSRWIPQSSLAKLDVYAGQGRGRIYRVQPRPRDNRVGLGKRVPLVPDLTKLSNRDLAAQLRSSNGTLRDLAHQLLIWRGETESTVELREILRAEDSLPATKIQALAALRDLAQLKASDVVTGLNAAGPEVRRFAVKLSEPFLSESSSLRSQLIALVDASSIRVRRQVALSLGATSHPMASRALADLLSAAESSANVRGAALNSISAKNVSEVIVRYAALPVAQQRQAVRHRLILLSLNSQPAVEIHRQLPTYMPSVERALANEDASQFWLDALEVLDEQLNGSAKFDSPANQHVLKLLRRAMETLEADGGNEKQLRLAMRLIGRRFGAYSQSLSESSDQAKRMSIGHRAKLVSRFISPRFPAALQREAVNAVADIDGGEAAPLLINAYGSANASVREAILQRLFERSTGLAAVIEALQSSKIRASTLSASQRARLLASVDPKLHDTANKALGSPAQVTRQSAIDARREAIKRTGQASQGRVVFQKHCSTCHRMEDHGHIVGPDLLALTNHDPKWLLTAILDPNQNVDARYLSWTAITTDGRMATGMIVEETSVSIRLREAGGKEHVIPRTELEAFRSTQQSLMPVGLERDLSVQDLSDLFAYLRSFQSPPKSLPGNRPQLVKQDKGDGSLYLTALSAEIRGGDITFESPFQNIGWWHHQNDSATWNVEIRTAGEYDIYFDASCAQQAAGNRFRIEGMETVIEGAVGSTGGWDRYRQVKVGTAKLRAGRSVIVVRPAGAIRQALFDLREVRIVPHGQSPRFSAPQSSATPSSTQSSGPLPRHAPEIAPFLLDARQSTEIRQRVIDLRPGMGPAIVSRLTVGLDAASEAEQYRRIPWIWRVAISVAKRNDGGEIRDLLEVSVPRPGKPLQDWQAVVIGGGLINGATQIGVWPKARMHEVLDGLPDVKAAWPAALKKSIAMANNKHVRPGTRYDALRMVALLDSKSAIAALLPYLGDGQPRELQMGAVSGLADVESPRATDALITALDYLKGRNRMLALEGLLRTQQRADALAKQLRSGAITISASERQSLHKHPLPAIRQRLGELPAP